MFFNQSRHIQKSFDKQDLHTLDGKRVEKVCIYNYTCTFRFLHLQQVTNSKFCSNESLRKLTGIIDKAEVTLVVYCAGMTAFSISFSDYSI